MAFNYEEINGLDRVGDEQLKVSTNECTIQGEL